MGPPQHEPIPPASAQRRVSITKEQILLRVTHLVLSMLWLAIFSESWIGSNILTFADTENRTIRYLLGVSIFFKRRTYKAVKLPTHRLQPNTVQGNAHEI